MQSEVLVGVEVGKAGDEVGEGCCTGPTVGKTVREESLVIPDAKEVVPEAAVEVVEDSRRGAADGIDEGWPDRLGWNDGCLLGKDDKEVNMPGSVVLWLTVPVL
jgi:hypothetical protein